MAMVVKNNMTAVNTLNILNKNSSALSKSLQKVSSGMKINSAADDASGYAISERMRVQIRSLDQANQNTQNGSSMMKVAEGAVSSTVEILKTLKEKAVNAANDSNTDSDRQTIQKELDQSIDQINDNANVTFNGKYLVDGSKNTKGNVKKSANAALDAFEETIRAQNKSEDNAISLQVGAKANQSIKVGLTDMRAEALGLQGADGTKLNISTQNKANAAINVLDNAIQKALDQQTTIGSVESRLEYTSSNLTTASENVQASESTIRDADMAKEMTNYTKNNVLLQAAQSMLAQANQSSSNVLSLLQ